MTEYPIEAILRTALWSQFGAAIDMLEHALLACPPSLWRTRLWNTPPPSEFPPSFSEFWSVTFHTLVWLDVYLSGAPKEEFVPPAPFAQGEVDSAAARPEQPFTREELSTYLTMVREKSQMRLLHLTNEQACQTVSYPWAEGKAVSFFELQLYNLRHVQEHVAHLSLFLGQHGISSEILAWVPRANDGPDR